MLFAVYVGGCTGAAQRSTRKQTQRRRREIKKDKNLSSCHLKPGWKRPERLRGV